MREVIFSNSVFSSPELIPLNPNTVLFHGPSVDDRGQFSASFSNKNISQRLIVNYDYDDMTICIDGHRIDADKCSNLVKDYVSGKNIVLESTTLGFTELFFIIRSLIDLEIYEFLVLYVEPTSYSRTTPGADSFALSELNVGYKPIPRAVVDLSGEDVEAGVFFLGFEPERLERAFEEYQMLSTKDIKVVFGIPAFQPGWELNSIVPHLTAIENCSIAYCAANDPSAAYDTLEATRLSLSDGNRMFVAPIGTKPCSLAAALHASIHSENVGLLYDHRKKKNKRSSGISVWHRYFVKINP